MKGRGRLVLFDVVCQLGNLISQYVLMGPMAISVAILIPARGGSKGVPRKNVRPLCGKPLIAHSIICAKNINYPSKIYVSTDDDEIGKIASEYGAVLIERPPCYSRDDSSMFDVLNHFINTLETKGESVPDLVVLLQPTSPLRKIQTVEMAITEFISRLNDYDSLMPVQELDGKIGRVLNGKYYPEQKTETRRQLIGPVYKECGTVFIYKTSLLKNGNMYGDSILPFIINSFAEAIDIDSEDDFLHAQILMRHMNEDSS